MLGGDTEILNCDTTRYEVIQCFIIPINHHPTGVATIIKKLHACMGVGMLVRMHWFQYYFMMLYIYFVIAAVCCYVILLTCKSICDNDYCMVMLVVY